jgi:hypothetical protein
LLARFKLIMDDFMILFIFWDILIFNDPN